MPVDLLAQQPIDLLAKKEPIDLLAGEKMGVGKFMLTPISKLVTGKSIGERTDLLNKKYEQLQKESDIKALKGKPTSATEFFLKSHLASVTQKGVELADISPLDVGLMAGTAGLAKIPIKGVPIGEAISKVPLGKGFMGKVEEMGKYNQWLKSPKISPTPKDLIQEQLAMQPKLLTPEQKVISALKEAKPLRGQQEKLYTQEREIRLTKSLEAGQEISGEKGFYAEKAKLGGEMPKVQFESIRNKLKQDDIDNLFIKVKDSPLLDDWQKITAREGLGKLFGEFGSNLPTEGELGLLNKVFSKELTTTLMLKRPLLAKMKEAGYQLLNIPRSIRASFDLSAPLRQGVFFIGRPKQFLPAFGRMFKNFVSEGDFNALQNSIAKRPTYDLMKKSGLSLTELGNNLATREEMFMSNWAEKIPLVGKGVHASGRAYVGFLNKLRADVFDDLITKAEKIGLNPQENPDLLKGISGFINTATGRGSLGGLERSAIALNSIFFSPRLMASRLSLLNPVYYVKQDPFVRKELLKSLFTFAGAVSTVLGMAKLSGAEVGTDWRSSDFGKMKVGNTRIDIMGGFQQYIRMAGQLLTGKYISSTTGKEYTLGEGYKPLTRLDIIGRQVESKEAPVLAFVTDWLRGQDYRGEALNIPKEIGLLFTPMAISDVYDLAKNEPNLLPLSPLGFFGAGLQTYEKKPSSADMLRKKLQNK